MFLQRTGFDSQHLYGSSQPSVSPVPGDQMDALFWHPQALVMCMVGTHTYMQKNNHTSKIELIKNKLT